MEDLSKWKKIGVMGGTFNPIHTGHLLLAQWAMEEAGLNGILFMPTGNSYMKDRGEMLPGSERLAMTRLAVADRDCFACSDLEVRRGAIPTPMRHWKPCRICIPKPTCTLFWGRTVCFLSKTGIVRRKSSEVASCWQRPETACP